MSDPICANCGKSVLECQGFCKKDIRERVADIASGSDIVSFEGGNARVMQKQIGNDRAKRILALFDSKITRLKQDCLTMALRLYGEDPDTFSPETAEVMDRWRPRVEALLNVSNVEKMASEFVKDLPKCGSMSNIGRDGLD